jgi:two-component sensor histidine kinase
MDQEAVVLWLRDITARKRAELVAARRTEQLDVLCRLTEQMGREPELRAILRLVLQGALDLINAAGGSISLWDETDRALVPLLHTGVCEAVEAQNIREGVARRVAATRSGLIVNDQGADRPDLSAALARIGVTASMAEPLLCGNRLIGVIHVAHTCRGATFTTEDASLLRMVATQASLAIEHARLSQEQQQAEGRLHQVFAELQDAAADRETLLREVQHRTKNNLQMLCDLLYLQIQAKDGPEGHPDLTDAYGRIYAFARLHEALHQSLRAGRISLGKFLAGIAEGFRSVDPGANIHLEPPTEAVDLDPDRALRLGLVLNELLANAVKHAFPAGTPGELGIAARVIDGRIELRVWDAGKGLPSGLHPTHASTLGFRIVTLFARQLGAQIHVSGPGTSVCLAFPLAAAYPCVGPDDDPR